MKELPKLTYEELKDIEIKKDQYYLKQKKKEKIIKIIFFSVSALIILIFLNKIL